MIKGIIFDIKEFAINDGPGIRTTIFMKGCPLRCAWCHNPEGLTSKIQKNILSNKNYGYEVTSSDLIKKLISYVDFFEFTKGGVTFSGGEPLLQYKFLIEVCSNIPMIHRLLDTSGYVKTSVFSRVTDYFDEVYYDLKIIDKEKHKEFTGRANELILSNLFTLAKSDKKYTIRVPLVPGITDTNNNINLIIDVIKRLQNKPQSVDFLPYNLYAGGKYNSVGLSYPLQKIKSYTIPEYIQEVAQKDRLFSIKGV